MSEPSIADAITSDLGIQPEAESPSVPATETPAPAEQPAEATPQPNGQSPEPESTPAPQAATQPAQEHQSTEKQVPLTAMLDFRDKWKTDRERADRAEARLREYESAQSQPFLDPNDPQFAQVLQEQTRREVAAALNQAKLNWSEEVARDKYGDADVDAAIAWGLEKARGEAAVHPNGVSALSTAYNAQKNPLVWIVKQHKREQALGVIGDDPEAYAREWALKNGYVPANGAQALATGQATPVLPQTPSRQQQPSVPRSLAAAPNAGGGVNSVPAHPLAALDEVFRGSG